MHTLRYACRSLAAAPLLSAVVIGSLAAGIGANTVVFSWLQTVLWKPLPGVSAAAGLQTVEARTAEGVYVGSSWPNYEDLHERLTSFEWLIAYRMSPLSFGAAPDVSRVTGLFVSGNYFTSLSLTPAAGRLLEPGDAATPGARPVVVVSYDFWQSRLGGAPSAIGQPLRINDELLTVVGVAPRRFQGTTLGLAFDMWLPATMAPVVVRGTRELDDRGQRGYSIMGRPRRDVPRADAQAELDAAMGELATAHPQSNRGLGAEIASFVNPPRGPQRMLTAGLWLLQVVMLLVLAAVCGNIANLLHARAGARQREFGIRLALGATRTRIGGTALLEMLLLSLAGAAGGVLLASWGVQVLRFGEVSGAIPIRFETEVDPGGLAFAAAIGLLATLAAGAAPAWFLASLDPQEALRSAARRTSRGTLRQILMGLQVALALLVLVVAALFFQRFQESRDVDPGFTADGVLLSAYDLTGRGTTAAANRQFAQRALTALRQAPGVLDVALAASIPLDIHGLPARAFTLEGRARPDAPPDVALSNVVSRGYLETMGIALVAGSDFAPLDDEAAPPQAIVNQAFVDRYLPGGDAIGRRIEARGVSHAIVGVARTTVSDAFGEAPAPLVLYSFRDRPLPAAEVHVKTTPGGEAAAAGVVRRVFRELDPTLPVFNVRTLPEHIARNLVLRRIPAQMFAVLGPLLILLAAVGVYAVVDYNVSQRTAEIGVRLALGASARRVVAQIVGETMLSVLLGVGGALSIAIVVDLHLVRGGVRDLPALVGVPVLLIAVAAAASWVPARRAALVDPVTALRPH